MGEWNLKYNKDDQILGYLKYNDDEYPFYYENGILNILPNTKENWWKEKQQLFENFSNPEKFKNKNVWIKNIKLYGSTNDDKNIIFIVSEDHSNINGFLQYNVYYLHIYSKNNTIDGLYFNSEEINYFYNPNRAYKTQYNFEDKIFKNAEVTMNDIEEIDCGSYNFKEVEINIKIRAIASISNNSKTYTPYTAKSEMIFTFSKSVDLDFALEVIFHEILFLSFICCRTNIILNSVTTFTLTDENKRDRSGVIALLREVVEAETDSKKFEQIISLELFEEKLNKIFDAIVNGNMYFEHLRSSIMKRQVYAIDRIILNFVAFEREYRNIYDNIAKRSEDYYEIRNDIIEILSNFKQENTGNKKKYIKEFIKSIKKSENKFSDRLSTALNDCYKILEPFLIRDYREIDSGLIGNISERMNTMRNDSAHGNIDLKIEPINIKDFRTIENLLYAMRLKYIGISDISIKKSINLLMGYHVRIE